MAVAADAGSASGALSRLERLLPLWIVLAMGLGKAFPNLAGVLDALRVDTVSLPIAIGLLWMMYPVLARVKYEKLGKVAQDWRLFAVSLALNWVIGLAWTLLPDHPEYRTGLIVVGLVRCIAMVLVWNLMARGNEEYAAILVVLNSVFQVLAYSVYVWFFIGVLPGWFGGETAIAGIEFWDVARAVLIFLGVPLAAEALTRWAGIARKGRQWYEERFIPRLAPAALIGLLFTIVVMFSLKGGLILSLPLDVLRISIPLLLYFGWMFEISFWVGKVVGFDYERTAAVSFTAASNNFELAIAVAIGVFGIASAEAFATVVGPLIEVPMLVGLVYVALRLRKGFVRGGG
ncbi:MAG: ACR3 family arsenite efflux transporter [Chloroflexota bacterium]|nr:ACR3 family arsenite efflux transporter [Chloroflexota bacterium]